ncbi:MAG: phospholipid carrier-dependent glycosyltransferase [Candidatus Paracaedibacteraceae bacterium]|nr:phospholipid carrier-dependent glycosyltransferase [Candidatus Paracaedibacteraceae bacterium]
MTQNTNKQETQVPFIQNTYNKTFWYDLFLLILLFAPLYFLFLGNRPFATPDEARYVEIPREMLATGDWITPRLNGVKYFEKPPLLYWVGAVFQYLFGLKEFAMRIPIVLFGLTGIIGTYIFGRHFFNRKTALYAAFILGSSSLYFVLSRLIILDMAVSTFITLSLFSFYRAQEETDLKKRRLFYTLFTLFCAFGVLTKGIMALVVTGSVILFWATYAGRWRYIFPAYLPSNLILFLVITAPWHILASLKTPEFAYKYFIVEHFLRYTTTLHLRHQPVWFFIPILISGFLPWSAIFFQSFRKAYSDFKKPLYSFLIIWFAFVFIFFSISQSKLIPYILPLFAPTALIVGHYLNDLISNGTPLKWPFKNITILSVACGIAALTATHFFPELNTTKIELLPYVKALSICFFSIVFFSLPLLKLKKQVFGIALSSIAIMLILIPASPHIQRPSLNTLIKIAMKEKKPYEPIASYMAYFQDLPVYANKTVMVVDAKGELEFGTLIEDTSSWMISNAAFQKELQTNTVSYWIFVRNDIINKLKNENPTIQMNIIACENNVCLIKSKKKKFSF